MFGEILEEQGVDLAHLMEEAISGRENSDEIIARMEKTLSEEHQRLLALAQQERMDETSFDLPGMHRAYQFLHISNDQSTVRIDRFPKNIRELAKNSVFLLRRMNRYVLL
ncbi:hypothetical protein Q4O60_01015 [Aeribacillus pallidus]|nr:hypothetical protein [Aeribacillus pallidus]